MWLYKMHNVFGNYSSHNYIKTHSRMRQTGGLDYLVKILSEESSSNKIEQRYTHSRINYTRGMYYNTTPLAKKITYRFLPLKNDHLFRHPPPPPVMIVYVTIMPCQRSHKRKIPTTPLGIAAYTPQISCHLCD